MRDLDVDKREILKCILNRWNFRACSGLMWLRAGSSGGILLNDNEPSGFIKGGEFLD
jgi:hypothetical protein